MDAKLELLINISKNMKVLYVEDQEDVCKQTLKILKNFFDDVTMAKNGKEGLKKFKSNSYHIIFTDLEMPKMSGMTLIRHIRELDRYIPIIVFSAHSKTEYFLEAIQSGIDGYILKPYDFTQISEVIAKVVLKLDIKVQYTDEIKLKDSFIWDKKKRLLKKEETLIKLTRNETKLFEILTFYINNFTNNSDIDIFVFGEDSNNSKRIRNLISRLRKKLGINLFESNYANGYRLKTN